MLVFFRKENEGLTLLSESGSLVQIGLNTKGEGLTFCKI